MKKVLLITLFALFSIQVFAQKSKMPVGVRTYTYYDETMLMDVLFKDFEGTFDQYDLNDLDSITGLKKYKLVFDEKNETWRLPLTTNEAMGLGEDGKESLPSTIIVLGNIKYAIRQKID
jgi:hypothetical protein